MVLSLRSVRGIVLQGTHRPHHAPGSNAPTSLRANKSSGPLLRLNQPRVVLAPADGSISVGLCLQIIKIHAIRHIMVHPSDMSKKDKVRFEQKFSKNKCECWPWTKGLFGMGYGAFWLNGRNHPASRISYILYIGKIPDERQINHRCNNRKCVNPAHLYAGTQKENLADAVRAGNIGKQGEENYQAKLRNTDIPIIRRMIQLGIFHRVIAEQFGVRRQSITQIAIGRSWRDY